jgi:fumarate reductase flavoprotein subunit
MGVVHEFVAREQAKLDAMLSGKGSEDATALRVAMQEIMTSQVGIFRTGKELEQAVDSLQKLLVRSRSIGLRYTARGANPELVAGYRIQKMLKVALAIAYGALTRTESRGAHFRQDCPRRDDSQWLKRTLATWRSENDTLPALAYEALDVRRMELPPGWRGYGAKDYVDHPDTAARAAEVEAIRKQAGLDRFTLQAKLMPYEHLLPARFRGRNERIDERFDESAAKRAAS